MKAKYILLAATVAATMPLAAQETYENAKLMKGDLNGTARYVGMGGAMEALGADISTISTNPAGIGLFRHSTATVSGGFVSQSGLNSGAEGDKTKMSFDQAGFVYSVRTDARSYMNFAFNYHKSTNFDFILHAADALSNASANKLTYQKWRNGLFDKSDGAYSQMDHLNVNGFNMAQDSANYVANGYVLNREHKGYIGDYDFNLSGNVNDRFFWGVTVGVKDVNYRHDGYYQEQIVSTTGTTPVRYTDRREIDGTGFDVKLGFIVRPIADSPFRFGAYVQSPTWYDLTTKNYSTINGALNNGSVSESYDYKITTPWKFGFSLGHTIGNYLALGATYEYADYGSSHTRVNDGVVETWDPFYGPDSYESSHKDAAMDDHTSEVLKGVSTLKLGLEVKPVENFSIRCGYNYVSPMYDESGVKGVYNNGGYVFSNGTYYASTADYTNWKATNRFTFGLGYQLGKWNFDMAYQYSATKGDFHPFATYIDPKYESEDNYAGAVEVKNDRSQMLFTIGYHF